MEEIRTGTTKRNGGKIPGLSFLQADYCCEGLICEHHLSLSFFNELSFPAAVHGVWSVFRRPVFAFMKTKFHRP